MGKLNRLCGFLLDFTLTMGGLAWVVYDCFSH